MGKHILVVDDEESTAFFLGESLSELGSDYQIDTASSGEDAIYKMAMQSFDLVITDLRMPGLSGLELLKWIRNTSPETRLILMTAYGSGEVEAEARRLEVYRYIIKPFRVEDLIDAARGALGRMALSHEGMLVLSDDTFDIITHRMDQLRSEIDAQCIFLADIMGQLITHSGVTAALDVNTLMSLLGGGFATTFEMARYLGQKQSFNLNCQEGACYDVYTSNVGDNLFLTIVYDKAVRSSRIGLVWLYTRRAVGDLLTITSTAKLVDTSDLLSADFGSSLQEELDFAFEAGGDDLFALTEQLEAPIPAAVAPTSQPARQAPRKQPPAPKPAQRAAPQASPPQKAAPKVPAAPARRAAPKPQPAVRQARPAAPPLRPSAAPAPAAKRVVTEGAGPATRSPSAGASTTAPPPRQGKDRTTYSLEEAQRMGLISKELLTHLLGRKDVERDS